MTIGRASGEPVVARRGVDLHAMCVPLHGCAFIYISHGLTIECRGTVESIIIIDEGDTHTARMLGNASFTHSLTQHMLSLLAPVHYIHHIHHSCTHSV